jgi:hypothetical protein
MSIESDIALSIHSFYSGESATGLRACERLLAEDLSPDVERMTRQNRTYYVEPLEHARHTKIDCQPARIGWSLFNPSICMIDGVLWGIVRSSNYGYANGRYTIPKSDGQTIKTENILCRFDYAMRVQSQQIVTLTYPSSGFIVEGMEDARLSFMSGQTFISGTIRDHESEPGGRCRIGYADIDLRSGICGPVRMLPSTGTQKNWMPIQDATEPRWRYNATQEVTADGSITGTPPTGSQRHWRGGGQVTPLGGSKSLGIVHEHADMADGSRVYVHRWVLWGPTETRWSQPFYIKQRGVEFAAGIVSIREDTRNVNTVFISYGREDA